jgi:hypothetical protein
VAYAESKKGSSFREMWEPNLVKSCKDSGEKRQTKQAAQTLKKKRGARKGRGQVCGRGRSKRWKRRKSNFEENGMRSGSRKTRKQPERIPSIGREEQQIPVAGCEALQNPRKT